MHPPLRSTDTVGSVGQVGAVKINGAGAGWVGQSPGLTRSLLKIECPAQAKPDVIHPGLDLTGGELEPAALLLLPTFAVVSPGLIPAPKQRSTERPLEPSLWYST